MSANAGQGGGASPAVSTGGPLRIDLVWTVLCAAAVAAVLLATVRAGWWTTPAWGGPGLRRFAWTLGALLLATAVPLRWLRKGAAGGALLIILLASGPQALIGCAWLLACAWVAGDRVLRWLDGEAMAGPMRDLLALAAGFALLALAVNIAVFFPVNSSATYAAAAALLMVLGMPRISARMTQGWRWLNEPATLPRPAALLLRAVLVLSALHLLVAAFPELGHDALSMHLAIPHVVAQDSRWAFDVERFVWSVMPMNANWLYTAASFLGGEGAARLLNATSVLLVGAAMVAWGRARLGPTAALAAAGFWLSLPLSFLVSNSAFIELPLTFLVVGTLLATEAAARTGRPGAWMLAGVLFGSSLATKLTALLIAPGLALVWAALAIGRPRNERRWMPGQLATGVAGAGLGAALFAAPPYLTAWRLTGNPVFPLFNQTFRSPLFDATSSFTNPLFVHPLDLQTALDLTLRTTRFVESQHAGALGIALLALVPLALAAAALRREAWVWVVGTVAAAFCALAFREQVYLRYILPALPLLCLVAAYALTLPRSSAAAAALALLCSGVALARFSVASYPLVWFPVQALASKDARDQFLRIAQPEQLALEAAARLSAGTAEGAAIFGLTPAVARGPANVLSNTWHSNAFSTELAAQGIDALPRLLLMRGVAWIVLPAQRSDPLLERAAQISAPVTQLGSVELRRIDPTRIKLPEMLRDPQLQQPVVEWAVGAEAIDPTGRGAWVTLAQPATQRVEVRPGARLRLEQDYVCPTPTDVRSQINWHDTHGRFISASIEVARCAGEQAVASVVTVPAGAASGIVYATPHTPERVLVRRMSLRLSATPIAGS